MQKNKSVNSKRSSAFWEKHFETFWKSGKAQKQKFGKVKKPKKIEMIRKQFFSNYQTNFICNKQLEQTLIVLSNNYYLMTSS